MEKYIDKLISLISTHPELVLYIGLPVILSAVFLSIYSLSHGAKITIGKLEISSFKSVKYDFQKKLIKNIRINAERTIEEITNLDYTQPLNWENEFLKTVNALYSGAIKVYAVTLSDISGFWVSEKDKDLIIEYLNCQRNKEIHRLFVFNSPDDLARYEEILESNYIAYGTTGGVYVTSKKNYDENLLPKFCNPLNRDKFSREDFGVWDFTKISILATLHDTQLTFKKITSGVNEINLNKFISSFKHDSIVKWKYGTTAETVSKHIFHSQGIYGGTVTHLVLLKHESPKILADIASKVVALDTLHKEAIVRGISLEFSQSEPWWGVNLQSIGTGPFIDKEYGGILHCDDEYKYALIIKLPSIDYLRQWYEYDLHSTIRKDIYIKLLKEVEQIYSLIDDGTHSDKAKGFQKIEEAIKNSGYLKRMDFVYNKSIRDIPRFIITDSFQSEVANDTMVE